MDKLYRELVDLPGAPSFEKPVKDYMKKNLEPYVEEILEDKLDRFHKGEIDIFVGTQMLSKGHNFKKVNLVLILGIDSMLNFPDFRFSGISSNRSSMEETPIVSNIFSTSSSV